MTAKLNDDYVYDDDAIRSASSLTKEEYADYLKNSMPRTRYFLHRWDLLYERFECEICDDAIRKSLHGRSLRSFRSFSGKYLSCVNLNVSIRRGKCESSYTCKIHICKFLPIVSGTKLDRSIRGDKIFFANDSHEERLGTTFMFGNFWIFNTFINTNTQLCHKYKLHNNSTESCTRMYVYDQNFRGNMLFYTNCELRIRDSSKREILVVDSSGNLSESVVSNDDPIVVDFANNVLSKNPYRLEDVGLFFLHCYEYMRTVFILRRDGGIGRYENDDYDDDDNDNDDNDEDEVSVDDVNEERREDGKKENFGGNCENEKRVFSPTLDIDDIDNKRVSSAPSLYASLIHTMTRNIESVLIEMTTNFGRSKAIVDDQHCENIVESSKPLIDNIIVDFAIVSHRAYLLRFISKKMMIRNDWSESMKRYLKTEMKMRQNNKNNVPSGTYNTNRNISVNSSSSVIDRSADGSLRLSWRVSIPDIPIDSSNNVVNQQQFYCGKIHDDVEYDHEQIKRLRVVNLNAMKCLMMPKKFERFLSFFNIGNISNAGRIMTSSHSMRESFFVDITRAIRDVTVLVKFFFRSFETYNVNDANRRFVCEREYWKILVVAVNEIPILSVIGCIDGLQEIPYRRRVGRNAPITGKRRGTRSCDSCVQRLSMFSFWSFLDFIKSYDSSCFVNVIQLRKGNYFLDVRVQNDIPACPVTIREVPRDSREKLSDATRARSDASGKNRTSTRVRVESELSAAAIYCDACREYKPLRHSLVVNMPRNYVRTVDERKTDKINGRKTSLPVCRRHIWCNRRELELMEFFRGEKFHAPFLHEIACHGLLSILKYPFATDISKIIVSINAHRRALKLIRDDYDVLRIFRDYNSNGKINLIRTELSGSGEICKNSDDANLPKDKRDTLKLFFAFGDFDMNNCEDGYVVDKNLDISVDTIFCKKINVSCDSLMYFTSDMSIEYMNEGRGIRLFVGTLRSDTPIVFSINSNVQIYKRRAKFSNRHSRVRYSTNESSEISRSHGVDDQSEVYDLYLTWSTSFLQSVSSSRIIDGSDSTSGKIYSVRKRITRNNVGETNDHDTLYAEEHCYDEREISRTSVEIYAKYIQLKLYVKNTKQTIKFQNSFGQKGMVCYRDLSDLVTKTGKKVDVISSLYSFVGRNACGQFLEQSGTLEAIFSRRTGKLVGYGGYGEFFVSDDSSHNNFIYSVKRSGENPMRMCRLTYESLLENEVSSAAFTKACEFEITLTNPYAGLPRNVRGALECYKCYGREIELPSQRIIKLRNDILNEKTLKSLESL